MSRCDAPKIDDWRQAIQCADVPASTKLVCYTVAQYCISGTCCSPSIDALSADANLSRTSIKAHLRRAAAAGLLTIEHPKNGRGGTLWLRPCLPVVLRQRPTRRCHPLPWL